VVGSGVDLGSVEGLAAGNDEAVGVFGKGGSHGAEVTGDEVDSVGLFDAEFFCVADDEAVWGVGSDGGEDGEFVDELGGEGAFDEVGFGGGGGRVGVDLEGADELAVGGFDVERADFGSEGGDDVEQGGTGGVEADGVENQVGIGEEERGAEEECGRGEVAGDGEVGGVERLTTGDGEVSFAPKARRACSEWSRVVMASEREVVPVAWRPAKSTAVLTWAEGMGVSKSMARSAVP
jgi:hypothetical protein